MDSDKILSVAKEAALAAGRAASASFAGPLQVSSKGFRDYVTEADIAAQSAITAIIRDAFPDHGFIAEEDDHSLTPKGPVLWMIDPIDGTTNYSRSVPLFCVSIAAVFNRPPIDIHDVILGVIYDPMREEMFSAVAGGRSQLNGRPIAVSSTTDLHNSMIATDWNRTQELRQATQDAVNRIIHEVDGLSSLKSAALALAYVAAGRLDAYFNYQLMPWDVAAASLLIQQAGGTLSGLSGQPLSLNGEPLACLASNGRLHDTLLSYIRPA